MIRFPRCAAFAFAVLVLASPSLSAQKRPMQVEDLYKFKRVASPRISPDGKAVAYQVTTVSLEANTSSTALWLADAGGKAAPKALTEPQGKKDSNPRWSPDGKTILFESNRSGSSQLWIVPAAGGEPKQITNISTEASSGIWSPDGSHIAFVSAVYPEYSAKPFPESDKLNKDKDDAIEKNPVKARVFTKLFYRHWVEYVGDKRQHLFVGKLENAQGQLSLGFVHDATPGDRDAYPTSSTFSSSEDFTFSPDGKHLVFTAVPEKNEAWSTNYDLCRVSITNTSPQWETLTKDNPAADSGPQFSPDGKKIAWRAQKKAGYEADKWIVYAADCGSDGAIVGKPIPWTERLDYGGGNNRLPAQADVSVNEFTWSGTNEIVVAVDQFGSTTLFHLNGPVSGHQLESGAAMSSLTAADGKLTFTYASLAAPAEVFSRVIRTNVKLVPVSRANEAFLAELERPQPELAFVPVEGGVRMQMWILKPPGFDPAKKWPVVYLVHGGPQGAWENGWSYRWNPQTWAARGYVVVMPNPRGSTGFGQKYVDEITADWGGKCYRDLVAGLDYVEKLPFVDKNRIASAGGSFGGYMMNWFAVNDVAPRFKCLITHCSVWNFESMWGTTDELWFDEYEHGGLPWEFPQKYREFSPHVKAGNLAKHKTPMLIIHNDLDFRCPIGQGHELFSALQRQGVPSRFVNFPDEGHWVLKPQNGLYWHKEVFGWLEKYCPPGGK